MITLILKTEILVLCENYREDVRPVVDEFIWLFSHLYLSVTLLKLATDCLHLPSLRVMTVE